MEEEQESELMVLNFIECNLIVNKLLRFLDESDQKELEHRLDAIKDVYKVLTTRDLEFEFRRDDTFYQKRGAKKVAKK